MTAPRRDDKRLSLQVINAETARYECTYGRGCEGVCCQQGRPPVDQEQRARIEKLKRRWMPLLRPEARALIEREGGVSRRIKAGDPMVRVTKGWCVFFNSGCVLHTLGAEDGKTMEYKPEACALFPLEKDKDGSWYVRQHGYKGEQWDLFCLAGKPEAPPATEGLAAELALAAKLDRREAKGKV